MESVRQLRNRVLKSKSLKRFKEDNIKYLNNKKVDNLDIDELKKYYNIIYKEELTAFKNVEVAAKDYKNSNKTKVQKSTRVTRMNIKNGYVYIIYNKENEVCKVGWSKKPGRRLKNLQVGCPYKLSIMFYFKACRNDEKNLHKILKEHSLVGEWFKLSQNLLDEVNKYKECLN
jgi:hypothetical protein